MDNKLYFIHEDNYLNHIDHQLEMYDLLLEAVRTLRKDLEAGETARALRDLCAYEQEAHTLFEGWNIPDEYAESGDPDDLAQLMEEELLPADDEDEEDGGEDDGEDASELSRLLLEAANLMAGCAVSMLRASGLASDMELEDLMRWMDEAEKPENDCAE